MSRKTSQSMIEKVLLAVPRDREFRAVDITDDIYPDSIQYDTEGRQFNRAVSAVAIALRNIPGIQEIEYGKFYFHSEYESA